MLKILKKICLCTLIMTLLSFYIWADGPAAPIDVWTEAENAVFGDDLNDWWDDLLVNSVGYQLVGSPRCSFSAKPDSGNTVFWFVSPTACTTIIWLENAEPLSAFEMVLNISFGIDIDDECPFPIPISGMNMADSERIKARWLRGAEKITGGEEGNGWNFLKIHGNQIIAVLIPLNMNTRLEAYFGPILMIETSAPIREISEGKIQLPNGGTLEGIRLCVSKLSEAQPTSPVEKLIDSTANIVENESSKFSVSAYPNPFNPITNISFTLPIKTPYTLKIFNIMGQLVKNYEGNGVVGLNTAVWDGKDNAGNDASSGVYFYKLTAGSFTATRKMVVLK